MEEEKSQYSFVMHYNIQDLVSRYQDRYVGRPVSTNTTKALLRLRSKTIVVNIDEVDVLFAASSLATGKQDLYLWMDLGVSTVNPGNRKAYNKLKAAATKASEDVKETFREWMSKTKPDNYNKKLGIAKAKASMKTMKAKVKSVEVKQNFGYINLFCEEDRLDLVYVKNFKTGAVKMYLTAVDGSDLR